MLLPDACFITGDALHDDCIHAYRIGRDNSVEHLCVSDSTMRITSHTLTQGFNPTATISGDTYDKVRLMIVDLFSSFQSQVAELSSPVRSLPSSQSCSFMHKGGIYRNNGIPRNLSKALLTGIHFSNGCNLHRSIGLFPAEDLLDETQFQIIEDCCYDRIDKQIRTVSSTAKELLRNSLG